MAMRKYFTMTDDEIPQNYYYDHLFCTRMMMDTLKVVWDGQEQYPELIDYLKIACPDAYFKTYLDVDETPIAHKYGSYEGGERRRHHLGRAAVSAGRVYERPVLRAGRQCGHGVC